MLKKDRIIGGGIALFLLIIIISGCTTLRAVYPDFSEQKNDIRIVSLFVDVTLMEEIGDGVTQIDISRNKELGKTITNEMKNNLSAKGYSVAESFILSGGATYQAAKEVNDQESETILARRPPFHIDEALDLNTEERRDLISLLHNMKERPIKKKGEPNRYFPEAAFLKKMTTGDALVFVLVEGRKVSVGKQLGQAMLTGLFPVITPMSGISVIAHQTSATLMNLYVVSNQDGELIWENRRFLKSYLNEEWLSYIAKQLVMSLPGKNNADAK